ncbi:MAG: histidine kinase dimerization/phospho-acceptor domain-containing protein [Actinomycetota bacterium]|nr:histidine kinase dimerization/phospho-acceptor domain-containing protein [Actinomycetota bacterium]
MALHTGNTEGTIIGGVVEPRETAHERLRSTSRLVGLLLIGPGLIAITVLLLYAIAPNRLVADVEALNAAVIMVSLPFSSILVRRNRLRAAAWLLIGVTTLTVFITQLAAHVGLNPLYHPDDSSALAYLVIPVFLSGVLLSRKATIALAFVLVTFMLTVPLAVPEIRYSELIAGPILLLSIITALIVAFSAHNERLGRQHIAALNDEITTRKAVETELARHRDELEDLVKERTADLNHTMSQLVEANAAKSRFLANMSHELRTPLNSIIGFTGLVHDGLAGEIPPEAKVQLSMANTSGKHLLSIVNDLLSLSRIEAGATTLDLRVLDISAALSAVCDMIRPLAVDKGCTARGYLDTNLSYAATPSGSRAYHASRVADGLMNPFFSGSHWSL